MRILHLLKHSVRGNGNVHVAVDLACEQADIGHDVVFVSARGSYDDLLVAHGVRVVTVPEAIGAVETFRSGLALIRLARKVRPDVIHAHMMSSAVLGFVAAKLAGSALVTTVHNSFDSHSVLMRVGRVVVAVSDAERRLLISRGFPARKVVTVLNGPDRSAREALSGEDLGPLPRPSVIVLSGLHPRKAVGDVIESFALVAADFPEWHLNIVGWGASQGELETRVAELGLGHAIHFLGSTLRPRPLLEQSEIFVTATLADPCPLTVGEARAAGCAVVATAVGGIPELLDHGRAGHLVPPRAPSAMAAALRELMGDPKSLAKWQRRALDGADHLTVPRMSRDYVRVYQAAVKGRRDIGALQSPSTSDGRLRIAYFIPPSRHFAGIERVVHEIASGLALEHGDRLDVHAIYATRYQEELLDKTPYACHVLGAERLRELGVALRRTVADIGPDVLVCPQVEASVTAWLATRGLGLPAFVPYLHGNPRVEEDEGSRRSQLAFTLFRHVVSRRSAGVLAVSPSLARYAATHTVRDVDVHYVPNPVRDLPMDSVVIDRTSRPFTFVSVARLSRQKGQDLLLRALAIARPDLPDVRVNLVGAGPDEDRLRQMSADLGLDDIVEFTGYTSDPTSYLRAADCFVLPSRWEGFGVVLVEALQVGLPLLAADCDFGPADVIVDPRIGELVAPGDESALAEGLRRAAAKAWNGDDEAYRRGVARQFAPGEATASQLEGLRRILANRGRVPERLVSHTL